MSPDCSALLGQPSWTETLRTPAPHGSRRAQHSLGGGPPPRPPKPQPGLQRLPEHQHITLITAPASSTFHPDGSSRPSPAFLLPSLRPLLPACLPTLGHPTGAAPTPRRLPHRSALWSLRRVHKQPRPRHPCQLPCAPPAPNTRARDSRLRGALGRESRRPQPRQLCQAARNSRRHFSRGRESVPRILVAVPGSRS